MADILDQLFAAHARPVLPVARRSLIARVSRLKKLVLERNRDPSRDPWPDTWYLSNDPGDVQRCRALWAEVLRAKLLDAAKEWRERLRKQTPSDLSWSEAAQDTRRLVSFVGGGEFVAICYLVDLDHKAVADRFWAAGASKESLERLIALLAGRVVA